MAVPHPPLPTTAISLCTVEAELPLRAVAQAHDVSVVQIDGHRPQAEGHDRHHDRALFDVLVNGIADPEQEGVEDGADDGTQGDVPRQNHNGRENHQQDHDDPPVDEGRKRAAGQNALAAVETEIQRKDVADDGKTAAEHRALVEPDGVVGPHDGSADEAGRHGFADVDEQDQQGVQTAVVAIEVRQPGVAAALGAYVFLMKAAGDQNGPVEAPQQITDERAKRKP